MQHFWPNQTMFWTFNASTTTSLFLDNAKYTIQQFTCIYRNNYDQYTVYYPISFVVNNHSFYSYSFAISDSIFIIDQWKSFMVSCHILFVYRWFCDGKDCGGHITGTKFQCMVCDDFDLCLGCQKTKNWPPKLVSLFISFW